MLCLIVIVNYTIFQWWPNLTILYYTEDSWWHMTFEKHMNNAKKKIYHECSLRFDQMSEDWHCPSQSPTRCYAYCWIAVPGQPHMFPCQQSLHVIWFDRQRAGCWWTTFWYHHLIVVYLSCTDANWTSLEMNQAPMETLMQESPAMLCMTIGKENKVTYNVHQLNPNFFHILIYNYWNNFDIDNDND